jgi:hypothetical protein
VGIAVFKIAFLRWVDVTNERPFPELIRAALDDLRVVSAGS